MRPITSPATTEPRPDDDLVLQAQGLTRTFSGRHRLGHRRDRISAVDGVSFELRRGESLGLVGESGCGKSTLARMLVGLERADAGSLVINGIDVTRPGRPARAVLRDAVQMVFQDPYTSLDPRLDVFTIIGEPLVTTGRMKDRNRRRERVAELLGQVGLSADMMSRFPHQFSGGQQQRIGIARALSLQPDVLVCDEPVSALDVSVQAQVVNLLREVQRRTGVALVFIAHDLSVVRHVADRTMVMYLGRLAEHGETTHLYNHPAHPYTTALLSASPDSDRRNRGGLSRRIALTGDLPSPADPPTGCRFHTRCPMAQPVCTSTQPTPHTVSEQHTSACHFADQVEQHFAEQMAHRFTARPTDD